MKHIFIINPTSGKKDSSKEISNYLLENEKDLNYEIYVTKDVGDAGRQTRVYCETKTEPITIYSCGGDGTLNEVINGAYGFNDVNIACFPCGSGNDFVKSFGLVQDFKNIDNLINGKPMKIDLIKVNNRYCVNICNLGFDAQVGYSLDRFKRRPLIKGKTAYALAVAHTLMFNMNFDVNILIDGVPSIYNNILLSAIGNGTCYGGGYHCLPKAKVNDGLLDVVVVKNISRCKFIRLVNNYKSGKYLDMKKYQEIIEYKRCKNFKLTSKDNITICLDGEIEEVKEVNIDVISDAINFITPLKH